ncbi:hypothetical protein [Streptomyces longwoodensis]|uniref:hypothetical protein n=1 Tax=Streptomyces longwoodensis TaxID=68231 RepID=UPI00340003C3
MSQTPERRMYLMWRALKRDRSYQHDLRKGWVSGPYMLIARRFRRPIREVRDAIDAQKGSPA